ncbi:MAG: M14 family metallopeptidase, partial [Gammaproteobacteria bacterium]|nr:M14 family metallopeptidase [Gammaproteobacteria bacterium]
MRTGSGYFLLLAIVITCLSGPVYQAKASIKDELLPPLKKWQGKSEQLIVASDNPWQTPAEKSDLTDTPRFSNGYGDIRHLPTILVENHSLKPYRQRVLGTYVFLEQSLTLLAREADSLRQATSLDKKSRPEHLVLSWKLDKENPEKKDFAGIEYTKTIDEITGTEYVQWTGKAKTYKNMSIFWERIPKVEVRVAKNYWIPSQYQQLQERLAIHGIQFEKNPEPVQIKAHQLIATEFKFKDTPFEGHQLARAKFKTQEKTVSLPKGSIRVSTDQPLGRLVVALLDPRGPDSFFSWGFFNQMFQRTEYIEN